MPTSLQRDRLESYVKDIVRTTASQATPTKDQSCCKKKKSINCIRDEVYDIQDVEDVLKEFNETYAPHLKKLSECFTSLDMVEKKRVNQVLAELKFLINEIRLKDIINDNLIALSCYLARLKVTLVTRDTKLSKQILSKFLKQKDINLNYIAAEIDDLRKKAELLEDVYLKFIDTVNGACNCLEYKMAMNHSGVHSIDKLKNIAVKQKELLYHIAINFTDISKNMLHDKDYRKLLKDASFLKENV